MMQKLYDTSAVFKAGNRPLTATVNRVNTRFRSAHVALLHKLGPERLHQFLDEIARDGDADMIRGKLALFATTAPEHLAAILDNRRQGMLQ